jgi:hypothetical protein
MEQKKRRRRKEEDQEPEESCTNTPKVNGLIDFRSHPKQNL